MEAKSRREADLADMRLDLDLAPDKPANATNPAIALPIALRQLSL
jgi:hypothetical protein